MRDEQQQVAEVAETSAEEPSWGELIKRATAKAEALEAESGEEDAEDAAEPEQEETAEAAEPSDEDSDSAEEGKVVPAERAKFRAEKREWREKMRAKERELQQQVEAAEQVFRPFLDARNLLKEGRYEEAVEAALGVDISELNNKVIERAQGKDPRVDAMERKLREYQEQEERRRAEAEKAAEEQRLEQLRAEHKAGLRKTFAESDDEILRRAAEHSEFLDQVFAEQDAEYDPDEDVTISPAEAAERVLDRYRKAHRALTLILSGDPSAENDGASPRSAASSASPFREGASPAKPARKRAPKVVNRQKAAEASPPGELDEKAWARKYTDMLREAEA